MSPEQIKGAFGTISSHDTGTRQGVRARLLTLLAIIGPGLIVMVGDNDAGGVSTYAQAGQDYGYTLLWTLPLLVPVLIIVQEMVVRLGAVTGVGHGRLIRERFGRYWGNLSIFSILVLNFLIIITEFIGISLSMEYFGVSSLVSVPVAITLLFAISATGSFRRWERFMMLFVAVNFLVVPLLLVSHPHAGSVVTHLVVPGIRGGANSSAVLLIISIIGTTVAPWQLFFQESNIVDKKITPRWINYERADTIIGSFIVVIGATVLVVASAALSSRGTTSSFTSTLALAHQLQHVLGHGAGAFFALILLNASIIGAAAVTLASSYAISDLSSTHQGLNARFSEARGFYLGFLALLIVAGSVAVIPHAPLGLITLAVQAISGLMLPFTTIIVLLLCNDRAIMGPWVNPRWLNAVATIVITALVALSVGLMTSTLFSSLNVVALLRWLFAVAGVGLAVGIPVGWRYWPARVTIDGDRRDWRTPRLTLLEPLPPSRFRWWLMRIQSVYLGVAGVLLVVRIVQLATA
ncbi:MAG: Nramp family divalent metal transporter [Acidobacteria bacterium]|nr:Nramp family divalent metal transporter [Acidobacteriota bacterium]